MNTDETPEEAMYRELTEETGLDPHHVEILSSTPGWLRYRLPKRFLRHRQKPLCIGQKQVWFLLKFKGQDDDMRVDRFHKPEFDCWRWVDFWYPLDHVVHFKKGVYSRALMHLAKKSRFEHISNRCPQIEAECAKAGHPLRRVV